MGSAGELDFDYAKNCMCGGVPAQLLGHHFSGLNNELMLIILTKTGVLKSVMPAEVVMQTEDMDWDWSQPEEEEDEDEETTAQRRRRIASGG